MDMMESVDSYASAPTVMMSLIDLLMLNAIVCGLEFCASAAFCYIPPMLLKAGIRCSMFAEFVQYVPKFGRRNFQASAKQMTVLV